MAKAAVAHSMRAPDLSRRAQTSPVKILDFACRKATTATEITDAFAAYRAKILADCALMDAALEAAGAELIAETEARKAAWRHLSGPHPGEANGRTVRPRSRARIRVGGSMIVLATSGTGRANPDLALAIAGAKVLEARLRFEILQIKTRRSRLRGQADRRQRRLDVLRALLGSVDKECPQAGKPQQSNFTPERR